MPRIGSISPFVCESCNIINKHDLRFIWPGNAIAPVVNLLTWFRVVGVFGLIGKRQGEGRLPDRVYPQGGDIEYPLTGIVDVCQLFR